MTTKLTIELKDGIAAALRRLDDVLERRTIEQVLIRSETDENDSGWSEEDYDKEPSSSPPARITIDEFKDLFQALGRFEELRELLVDYYVNPIPIKALLPMFQYNKEKKHARIESLGFFHTSFVGDVTDFQALAELLQTESVCTKVCLRSCKTPGLRTIGPLVDAFSVPLNLTELTLEEMEVPGDSLAMVCGLARLSCLKLRHIPSCNPSMPIIAEALSRNSVLQSIQICYALDQNSASAFFRMLEKNSTIKTVDIDMDCWDMYGQPLGRALKANNTLKNLELNVFGDDDHVEANALSIAKSLEENTSLRRLYLTFHKPLQRADNETSAVDPLERLSNAFLEPFAKVMQSNLSLGDLRVGPIHQRICFDDRVNFILKLNYAGRRELLEPNEASRNVWVETLINYRDDLNVLFYFLSMNPSLAEENDSKSDRIVEPRYKRLKLNE